MAGILVFTSATQGWFFNRLKIYEIIIFLVIATSLLRPGFILNKFIPEYNFKDLNQSQELILKPEKEVRVKVTRLTEYGERYKLFVIPKNSFEENYDLEKLGISVISKDGKFVIDDLKWNGLAKKIGLSLDDQITEFKVENLNRPNKAIVYPFAFLVLFVFGYLNYRRKTTSY